MTMQALTLPPGPREEPFLRIHELRAGGGLRRYHAEPHVPSQTIAEHSWNMAMMALVIYGYDADLAIGCLAHDLGENASGDPPSYAKARYPELARLSNQAEWARRVELGVEMKLSERQQRRLKFLDRLELCWRCAELYAQGNMYARAIYEKVAPSLPFADDFTTDKEILACSQLATFMEKCRG